MRTSPNPIVPEVGRSTPVIILAMVDLPLPLAPTSAIDIPGSRVKETSSTARVALPLRPFG